MTDFKKIAWGAAAFLCCVFLILPSTASADFLNPGFEDEEAGGPATNAADWIQFAGSTSTASRDSTMPRTGGWAFLMSGSGEGSGFGGAFQEFAISPGDPVEFSAWAKVVDMGNPGIFFQDADSQMRMRFEWRSGGSSSGDPNTQINITEATTGTYQKFTVSDTAPAGVDAVRAVFAVNRTDDHFFFDDVSFTVVPEPASFGLALVAGLGLLYGRRRN